MTICKFYQQGNCRFGNTCRFEHPSANGSASANPFSVLSGNSNTNNNRGGFGRQPAAQPNQFSLSKDTIQKDLAEERPAWILSAYGPGRDAPEQLWGGYPIEQSFEEIRLHYMTGEASGNAQGALNEIQGLWGQAQSKIQSALGNIDGAIDFILQSQNNHPNRHDVCQANSSPSTGEFAVGRRPIGIQPSQPANAFSAPSTGGAFGQPTALGQNPNPFSAAAGGASGSSPFAQPAAPAQPSGFGQPSALGGGGSAFGRPSALGGGSGFGQPSALGGGSTFGQPSGLGQTPGSGFGQPSALGQPANAFSAPSFGQPAQPSTQPAPAGGFGQPSQLGTKPNPFSGGTVASSSPFGALGGASSNPSPFAAASSSPFGQAAPQSTAPEVSMDTTAPSTAPNPFAQAGQPAAAPANPFGQPAQPAASNPFAQAAPASNGFAPGAQKPAGVTPGASNPYAPDATRQHPPYDSYARKAPSGHLVSFKGKQVTYKEVAEKGEAPKQVPGIQDFDGSWTKIWFPDGPLPYYKDTEPGREYTDAEKAAYEQFVSTGRFTLAGAGGSGMPEAPPWREYCTWDL
ncbi:CCCH zinc finger domain-containing protein [Diaporthe sp. PMI_573]|nr:CCCH zinc finger domain-containing protein [Diaporthaceae sp. PMI_573]